MVYLFLSKKKKKREKKEERTQGDSFGG